jgi:hypothetical protein
VRARVAALGAAQPRLDALRKAHNVVEHRAHSVLRVREDGGAGGGAAGAVGGSGVVIIAYPNTFPALTSISGGLTYDQPTRSGYRVYRFTNGTGPIQW